MDMDPPTVKAELTDSTGLAMTPASTPQKRSPSKKTIPTDDPESVNYAPESPTKKSKTKSPSKKPGPFGPIPASYEEAGAEDKMIIQLKETEGKTWAEIRQAMEESTVSKLGSSTAQVRYTRMKANFVVFEKGDETILIQAKKDVEEKFEWEMWQRIADIIEAKNGNKYPSASVQKKFKEMSKKSNGNAITTGMEE